MPRPPAPPGQRGSWHQPAASLAPAVVIKSGTRWRELPWRICSAANAKQQCACHLGLLHTPTPHALLHRLAVQQPSVQAARACLITAAPESRLMPRPRRKSRTSLPLLTLWAAGAGMLSMLDHALLPQHRGGPVHRGHAGGGFYLCRRRPAAIQQAEDSPMQEP